jgi:hypothetical protein
MRRGILFAITGDQHAVVLGPEVPVPELNAAFKRFMLSGFPGGNPERMELWTSDSGRIKRYKFKPAMPAAAEVPTEVPVESEPPAMLPTELASEVTQPEAGEKSPASKSKK